MVWWTFSYAWDGMISHEKTVSGERHRIPRASISFPLLETVICVKNMKGSIFRFSVQTATKQNSGPYFSFSLSHFYLFPPHPTWRLFPLLPFPRLPTPHPSSSPSPTRLQYMGREKKTSSYSFPHSNLYIQIKQRIRYRIKRLHFPSGIWSFYHC